MTTRRLASCLLLLACLSACGFQLRGSRPDSRLPFTTLYLDVAHNTQLERDLRSAILAQDGIKLMTDAKSAQATLHIVSEGEEKKILTLNAQGQVREFSLLYRLRYEVKETDGKVLLKPTELALQAFMSYSEAQALAKETEQKMIFSDLRSDAINQLIRQMAQLKPTPEESEEEAQECVQACTQEGTQKQAQPDSKPAVPAN
jgi:LPS-assembly lipoprotein